MKENELTEMMLSIKRNAQESNCIKNFENLILEIGDPKITNIFISEMSGFMSKLFELFHEADKLDSLELKSRIISKTFIDPDKYFKKSRSIANKLMRIRAAIEYLETPKHIFHKYTKDVDRKAIRIRWKEAQELGKRFIDWAESVDEFKEQARRIMLLYHYIPAVYKALIQTKRRSLGLDCNSKKFG